jgi:hypothetical protein
MICLYHIGCVIFGTRRKTNLKIYKRKQSTRLEWRDDSEGFQATIHLGDYIRRNTFNTWCPSVSYDKHNPVWETRDAKFMVPLPLTPATSFRWFRMQNGWFFLITPIFNLLFFINIFNWQHFYLASYSSSTWAKLNGAFCGNTRAEWWLPKKGATVHW